MILHWVQLLRLCPIKCVLVLITLGMCFPAYSGVISGTSDLQVINTKYFDIIYPLESAFSAKILAEEADSLYLKACKELGSTPYFRLPVVITPSYDSLNAYFSIVPYNRIVLYDVLPEVNDSSSLAVFSETLKSVFYHELVHCVSLNMKGKGFQFLGNIFGDWVNPALLNLNTLFIEGGAVALESQDGEGRLNNGFSLHVLRQAKLENDFPTWLDASGARDIYPSGNVPYIFGGAFTEWLLNTYGKEKYTSFLYETAKIHFFKMTAGIFKKVYGVSLKTAWDKFKQDVYVPNISLNPEADFSGAYIFDSRINKKGLYRSLSSSNKGFAWIDSYTDSVKYLPNGKKSAFTLLEYSGLYKISLDKEGNWLVASRTKNGIVENQVFVYNIETGEKVFVSDSGLREGIIFFYKEKIYCVAIHSEVQNSSIVFYEIFIDEEKKITIASKPAYKFSLPQAFPIYSLIDTGDGRIAFLGGGKSDSLYIFDPILQKCQVCYLGNNLKECIGVENFTLQEIVSLKTENNKLMIAFSWATKDSFPRLGLINISSNFTDVSKKNNQLFVTDYMQEEKIDLCLAQVFLSKEDVSGGVYSPVPVYQDSSLWNGEFHYSAHFFDHDRMMFVDSKKIEFEEQFIPLENFVLLKEQKSLENNSSLELLENQTKLEAKNYNPVKYIFPGLFIPFGSVSFYDAFFSDMSLSLLGVTWISTDPAETGIYSLTGSYSPKLNVWGLSGGITTDSFSLNGSVIFDRSQFAYGSAEFNYSDNFELGSIYNIGLYNSVLWAGGYNWVSFSETDFYPTIFTNLNEEDKTEFINSVSNATTIRFSTLRSGGKGYHNLKGFALSFNLLTLYSDIIDGWYNNLGLSYIQRIPGYVPIEAIVSIFPSNISFLDLDAYAYLYTWEIQKGIPWLQLYLNRFSFVFGYEGTFNRRNDSWDIIDLWDILREMPQLEFNDNLFVRLESVSSLNTTIMTGFSLSLYADFILRLRHSEKVAKYDFRVGLNLSL